MPMVAEPQTDMSADRGRADRSDRWVRAWLYVVAAMVFAMVVVGGITRLTGSGLSITEWAPILGAWPPTTAADWDLAFERYRAIRRAERAYL